MTDNAEKNLTPLYVGEKISNSRDYISKITHTPLPHKRPMVMSTIYGATEETDLTL